MMARIDSRHSMFTVGSTVGRTAEDNSGQEKEIIVDTNAARTLGAQRWRQAIGTWLALALLIGTLLTPTLLPGSAEAKRGGKHGGKHCVGLVAEGRHKAKSLGCYRTFAEAVGAATEGQVRLARDAEPGDLTDRLLERGRGRDLGAERSTQSIIGIFYDAVNYSTGSGSYTVVANGANGCNSGTTWSYNTMPSGWNNRVSSAKTFSGCKATFYADSYLSGASKTGAAVNGFDIPDFESLSNAASSVRWTRA